MFGGFGGLFAVDALVGSTGRAHGLGSVVAVLVGVAAGAAAGGLAAFVLERVAYRPLRRRHAPPLAFLISAIGASYFALNLAGKEFGRQVDSLPTLFHNGAVFTVFGARVLTSYLVIAAAAALMLVLLDRIIAGTRLGQGIRSVAQDAETASLMGVDINRVITQTFVLGGLLGGAAGFLYGLAFNVSFNMGFVPGLKAFTAAVLGGIGNVRGAVLGGLLLGVAENLPLGCIQAAWQDVISFAILVGVLMLRPTGLLGQRLGRSA